MAADYTVLAVNHMESCGRRYGVSINQLCRLNGITRSTKLQVGRVLRVK